MALQESTMKRKEKKEKERMGENGIRLNKNGCNDATKALLRVPFLFQRPCI